MLEVYKKRTSKTQYVKMSEAFCKTFTSSSPFDNQGLF